MTARGGRWLTRPVLAWALYDVASSAFAAVVPPFFGLYFVSAIAGDLPGAQTQWGVIASVSLVLAGLLAPFAGAWVDRRRSWLELLAAATALCVVATVAMPTTASGKVIWAAALFVAAQVGYTLAVSVYDSLLVRVAAPEHVGRVSGLGWSVGFGGGILALAASLILFRGLPADAQAARLSDAFLLAGVVFAAFAVPGLLGLRRLGAPPGDARTFALARCLRLGAEHAAALAPPARGVPLHDRVLPAQRRARDDPLLHRDHPARAVRARRRGAAVCSRCSITCSPRPRRSCSGMPPTAGGSAR